MSLNLIAVVMGGIAAAIGLLLLLKPDLARRLESISLMSSLESTWFLTREQLEAAKQSQHRQGGATHRFVPLLILAWGVLFALAGVLGWMD